ncbi:hypothetical protein [Streptomyces sp. NPDC004296]|uniref:hypothetical protein n=1 Tax=Streptomyces sp. NPDC004296 TaxID=3364697 RepID=UPI00368421DB
MSTSASTPPGALPPAEEVFAFAREEINRAATALWPDADIQPGVHVPSVTGYVQHIAVDGCELYAKHSFLGISLVSLLRGAAGDWAQVQKDQQDYIQRPDALMQREATQLRLLAEAGRPRVCTVAGLAGGVLFTEPVAGPSLATLLLQRPEQTAPLLDGVLAELHHFDRTPVLAKMRAHAVIGERSIAGTFLRKFNGLSGSLYLERLGSDRCTADRARVVEAFTTVVQRLRRQRATLPSSVGSLAYGDLKPEHVFYPDGIGGRPVFIDPGLLGASSQVDTAKLMSRTLLLAAATRPSPQTAGHITDGIEQFVEQRMQPLARDPRARQVADVRAKWLRELLVLWLMDTVNIMTTYLSAPAALPLPATGLELLNRAAKLGGLLDEVSAHLTLYADPHKVFGQALAEVTAVIS